MATGLRLRTRWELSGRLDRKPERLLMFQITPATHASCRWTSDQAGEERKKTAVLDLKASACHPMISSGTALNLVRFCNKGTGKIFSRMWNQVNSKLRKHDRRHACVNRCTERHRLIWCSRSDWGRDGSLEIKALWQTNGFPWKESVATVNQITNLIYYRYSSSAFLF